MRFVSCYSVNWPHPKRQNMWQVHGVWDVLRMAFPPYFLIFEKEATCQVQLFQLDTCNDIISPLAVSTHGYFLKISKSVPKVPLRMGKIDWRHIKKINPIHFKFYFTWYCRTIVGVLMNSFKRVWDDFLKNNSLFCICISIRRAFSAVSDS